VERRPDTVGGVTDFVPSHAAPGDPGSDPSEVWYCVAGGEVLLGPPHDLGLAVRAHHFLGLRAGAPVWAADVDGEVPGGLFTPLRQAYGQMDELSWTIAGRAVQLVEWDRTHQYCGRCATPTEANPTDRSKRCPSCGLLAYPRLAPAVITLVTRGDEALLARGVNFPIPMYSCLAGFVEAGETLEQAVIREIHEEVGVVVDEVAYVQSQPWPFPHSLMIGFHARWASGDIEIDPTEILDANWYRRDQLPMVPPTMSIAGRLIEGWVAGRIG
jgi:NAD+ diphosphatase